MMEDRGSRRKCALAGGIMLLVIARFGDARANGEEHVLYSFQGGNDGERPAAGLIMDKKGNLYGATFSGGGDTTTAPCSILLLMIPRRYFMPFSQNMEVVAPILSLAFLWTRKEIYTAQHSLVAKKTRG